MSEEKHTAVRRVAGRAFTTGELLDYEKFIDETASQLISIMRNRRCLNATLWFQCFATEVVNRVAFTDKMGFLDQGGDVEGLIAVAEQRFDYWNKWAALPGLEWLLAKSPIAQLRRRPDSVLALVSRKKIMSRGKEKREQSMKEGSMDLLQKLLDGQAKHPGRLSDDDILGVVMSIMSAGADTTATTFVAILFHLMKYPKVLAKLRAEVDQGVTGGSISNPPSWKEVYQLPYLEAVVKETMRYWPPFAFGIDRIVPDPGAMIAGTMIPPGAEIGAQVESVHRDYSVYGSDADEYRPERWIEASEGQHALMEKSFLGFSTGKRVCLGMHIAIMELKKVIPLILMNFDVSPGPIMVSDSCGISAILCSTMLYTTCE
jgi:cytochrome P450